MVLNKNYIEMFFPITPFNKNELVVKINNNLRTLILWYWGLRTIATCKLPDAQAFSEQWWGNHHQIQSCSNLPRHARCLPVASVQSFNRNSSYNGSPCYIDNWIDTSVKDMASRWKIGASYFPIFTLSNAKQINITSISRQMWLQRILR